MSEEFLFLLVLTCCAHFSNSSLYSLTAESVSGDIVPLDKYKGKVSLVVNVASECGYTDLNYKELVKLQQNYQDKGFTVLAFPSNQFGQQEPGTNEQILSFASKKYDINFPLFSKVDVVGGSQCDVYKYLTGKLGSEPSWNFCKYLVDRTGEVVQYFSVQDTFSSIVTSVEYLLTIEHSEL